MTSFGRSPIRREGPETAVGWSPDGDALYTCSRCPGLHRKYEDCPKPQYDTGDPWNSPYDGNPEVPLDK